MSGVCFKNALLQNELNSLHFFSDTYIRYAVLSVNEYTPFEKYNFKQYLNEHKNFPKCWQD